MSKIKDNKVPKSIDEILLNKIDVKAGDCTFGQYIGLKQLIRNTTDEVEIVEGVLQRTA